METEPRKGARTSEFWLAVAACVIGALLASGLFEDAGTMAKIFGLVSSVLASLGYSAARAFTKVGEAKAAALVEAAKATPLPPPQ